MARPNSAWRSGLTGVVAGSGIMYRVKTMNADPATTPVKDRKSTRLNSSHLGISYAVFCLKKKIKKDKLHDVRTTYTKESHEKNIRIRRPNPANPVWWTWFRPAQTTVTATHTSFEARRRAP